MDTIKNLRIKAGITQAELADLLGVTQGAVSQWEAQATSPNIKILPKLASIFGCTIDDLLKENDNK